ncbi:hypothetical protein SAMN02983003_0653 [Devosia enhydra]|uniref:MAPEG family protein n=1 Tax=Devosia enhydra TaxID=665118 RepID=A0A1K2HTT4_9HYPH|nr:MAPEG family protein [Devosia enhydra]SFZ81719.1 hypothetical protein SAMN02983003_0653 [Devosia enhydra]
MTGNALWLIASLLVLGLLPLGLVLRLGAIRLPLVFSGKVKVRDIALSRTSWPEDEKKVSNAFDNQFQLPVLYAVAVFIALAMGPGLLEVVLGWAFVVSRYGHAAIHITSNHIFRRFWAYCIGLGLLWALWLWLIIRWVMLLASGVSA